MSIHQFVQSLLQSDSPGDTLRRAYASGELRAILPEVHALYGVPQPAEHHPEVDTGWHIELCINQAQYEAHGLSKSSAEALMYAVLLHDVGKAVTVESWPLHPSHESLGVPLVEAINRRSDMPLSAQVLALTACKEHLKVHRFFEMKEKSIIRFLTELPSEHIMLLALACRSDARGRLGMSQEAYPQADALITVGAALLREGLYPTPGSDMLTAEGQTQHRNRLAVVKQVIQNKEDSSHAY